MAQFKKIMFLSNQTILRGFLNSVTLGVSAKNLFTSTSFSYTDDQPLIFELS